MKKLDLSLTKEELTKLNYEKNAIRNLLVSRAIYNESLEYEFTKEEQNILDLYIENEKITIYLKQEAETKMMINENQIIDAYNANKSFFEENKMSFKEAHEMIKEQLKESLFEKLANEFISEIVLKMDDSVTLTKDEILATKGDANNIKQVLQNKIIKEYALKNNFYKENEEALDLVASDIRINYYTSVINSKDIQVSNEEIDKVYEENKEAFENVEFDKAKEMIAIRLANEKVAAKTQEYAQMLIEKYDIDKKVEEILNDRI
ncbi:hypothetical protein [Oceanivirga miroungae]|uniref:Trigger factor n=1 Tax=Oceanivirga miroungae TaxID=1130046 RepID=A0A6I8MDT6_9FUSO|nr:hypothetical protein [Oceanivirga miroungae]VWL85334.1 hypothetical protein OMES3154_00619 [Oceanivirga miroungae]